MYLRYDIWQTILEVHSHSEEGWVNEFVVPFSCVDTRFVLVGYGWKPNQEDENISDLYNGVYKCSYRKVGDSEWIQFARPVCERASSDEPYVYKDIIVSTGELPKDDYEFRVEAIEGTKFESWGGAIEGASKGHIFWSDLQARFDRPIEIDEFDSVKLIEFCYGGKETIEILLSDILSANDILTYFFIGYLFDAIDDHIVYIQEYAEVFMNVYNQIIDVIHTQEYFEVFLPIIGIPTVISYVTAIEVVNMLLTAFPLDVNEGVYQTEFAQMGISELYVNAFHEILVEEIEANVDVVDFFHYTFVFDDVDVIEDVLLNQIHLPEVYDDILATEDLEIYTYVPADFDVSENVTLEENVSNFINELFAFVHENVINVEELPDVGQPKEVDVWDFAYGEDFLFGGYEVITDTGDSLSSWGGSRNITQDSGAYRFNNNFGGLSAYMIAYSFAGTFLYYGGSRMVFQMRLKLEGGTPDNTEYLNIQHRGNRSYFNANDNIVRLFYDSSLKICGGDFINGVVPHNNWFDLRIELLASTAKTYCKVYINDIFVGEGYNDSANEIGTQSYFRIETGNYGAFDMVARLDDLYITCQDNYYGVFVDNNYRYILSREAVSVAEDISVSLVLLYQPIEVYETMTVEENVEKWFDTLGLYSAYELIDILEYGQIYPYQIYSDEFLPLIESLIIDLESEFQSYDEASIDDVNTVGYGMISEDCSSLTDWINSNVTVVSNQYKFDANNQSADVWQGSDIGTVRYYGASRFNIEFSMKFTGASSESVNQYFEVSGQSPLNHYSFVSGTIYPWVIFRADGSVKILDDVFSNVFSIGDWHDWKVVIYGASGNVVVALYKDEEFIGESTKAGDSLTNTANIIFLAYSPLSEAFDVYVDWITATSFDPYYGANANNPNIHQLAVQSINTLEDVTMKLVI